MNKSFKIASLKNKQLSLKGRVYPNKITIPGKTYYKSIVGEDGMTTQAISYSTPDTTKIISARQVKRN